MTIRLSSGMRDAVVSNFGIGALLSSGYIRIFSGAQPDSPDMPPTGDYLGFIVNRGYFYAPPYPKHESCLQMMLSATVGSICNVHPWTYIPRLSGIPGWWRFYSTPGDDDTYSTTKCRMDGLIGDSFTAFPTSVDYLQDFGIEQFTLTLPAQ